ncbi:MAG: IS1595 family transposase [Veillonella sp.]|nr:IS1595 family transposase [Veillonella sp.]
MLYNSIENQLIQAVMIDFSQFKSILSLTTYFNTNEKCKQAIAESRWADGDVICPYCGKHHCKTRTDGRYRCPNCRLNFSVTVGTIFENSPLPLIKWFVAMFLISCHKKGISSLQLATDIEVTQKTAWYMLMKIRSLYVQETAELEGEVELDEAYIGGKEQWKHESKKTEGTQGRSTKTKTPIFGLVERKGDVIVKVVEDTKGKTLSPIIRRFVKKGSRIFTDEYVGYHTLDKSEYKHEVVFHNEKKFVDGDAHTNTMEGFWGHFKRMICGTYHFCSSARLQMYVNEQVFRWNSREWDESERFTNMFKHCIGTFTYQDVLELVAA